MTKKIKSFFETSILPENKDKSHEVQFAITALLVGMILRDDEIKDSEYQALLGVLESQFNLDSQEVITLYKLVESEVIHNNDFSRYIGLINQSFIYDDKLKVVGLLWRIAYSDRQLHRDESNFVREISIQLGVKDIDFDISRNRIRDEFI